MAGIEEKLVNEAVKPASGFINALLGPKIETIKEWAKERHLDGLVDKKSLPIIFEKYLLKLAERVSEITSISFPQHKLNIFDAYEPLNLKSLDNQLGQKAVDLVTVDDLVSSSKKAFLVVDNAGMGKSTFSKFLVAKLLSNSSRIPILLELRKVTKDRSLVENLASGLDFPGQKFNRELFYKLIELGKFYVILDGFDEVQLEHQETVAGEIYDLSLKGGENNLLVTSRPQEMLPELNNGYSLRFIPFNAEQASSLLQRYDKLSGLDVGERLLQEINSVPQRFIESPLLISLLYRTFGVNNSIADRISTFYDEIYQALYKGHDLINKNGYGREKKSKLDFEDFRKLLRALSYYMMLNRKTSFTTWSEAVSFIGKSIDIASVNVSSASHFLDDALVAVPVMQRDGSEYKFLHKTMLEYFAAEYLVYDKSSRELVEKIFKSKIFSSFDKVFEFLNDLNASLFDSVVTLHFAKKASEIVKEDSYAERALSSLIFVKDSKIGLWKTKDYSMRLNNEDDTPVLSDTPEFLDEGFYSNTWVHGEINGEDYMLALTYRDSPDNLHLLAWRAITEEFNLNKKRDTGQPSDFNDYVGAVPLNDWKDVDVHLLNNIACNHSVILSLIRTTISSERFRDTSVPRILSTSKIKSVIETAEKAKEFENEMDKFL